MIKGPSGQLSTGLLAAFGQKLHLISVTIAHDSLTCFCSNTSRNSMFHSVLSVRLKRTWAFCFYLLAKGGKNPITPFCLPPTFSCVSRFFCCLQTHISQASQGPRVSVRMLCYSETCWFETGSPEAQTDL